MEWSPFMIPLGAFVVAVVAIVSGVVAGGYKQKLKADQRLVMLARGMSAEEIDKLLTGDAKPVRDRSIASTRRTAILLISSGIGVILFFLSLAYIVHEHDALGGAPIGLVPLAIGVGFLIDYKLQKRDLSRFGVHLGHEE